MSDHYICKVNSGHGSQYAHIEVPQGQPPPVTTWVNDVEVGPFPTPEEAWAAWHVKQGALQA